MQPLAEYRNENGVLDHTLLRPEDPWPNNIAPSAPLMFPPAAPLDPAALGLTGVSATAMANILSGRAKEVDVTDLMSKASLGGVNAESSPSKDMLQVLMTDSEIAAKKGKRVLTYLVKSLEKTAGDTIALCISWNTSSGLWPIGILDA